MGIAHGAVCTRIKNFEFWILTFDDFDNLINCLILDPLDDTLCCGGVVVAGKSTDSLVKTKEHLKIVFNQFNWTTSMKLLLLLREYTGQTFFGCLSLIILRTLADMHLR